MRPTSRQLGTPATPGSKEPEIRIRPSRAGRTPTRELRKWTPAFVALTRVMRASGRATPKHPDSSRRSSRGLAATVTRQQRVAVRITYTPPKMNGHWKAHGAYLQRESATGREDAGFDAVAGGVSVPGALDAWQKAGDARLYKILISPEAGTRLDLEAYTRKVMGRVALEVGSPLEWVAVRHYNTDHPHVHVALRSRSKDGREVWLSRQFVQQGVRDISEKAATATLGLRTEKDIREAQFREIEQARVTALDRSIMRMRERTFKGKQFDVTMSPRTFHTLPPRERDVAWAMHGRLEHLAGMGLVMKNGTSSWRVPVNYTSTLRTLQTAGDRQRMLQRHMEFASAPNLPIVADGWKRFKQLEGRVLGHGEEESTGKRYLLIEGVDGKVHYLPHRRETEELRATHRLRNNQFVTIRKYKGEIKIKEHGHAEALLNDPRFLSYRKTAVDPSIPLRPGWLGRFDAAVASNRFSKEAAVPDQIQSASTVDTLTPQQIETLLATEPVFKDREAALQQLLERKEPLVLQNGNLVIRVNDAGSFVAERTAPRQQNNSGVKSPVSGMQAGALSPQQNYALRQQELVTALNTEGQLESVNASSLPDDQELAALFAQAGANAKDFDGDLHLASDPEGVYRGTIIAETERYLAQFSDGKAILHERGRLEVLPRVGQQATIAYTARYPQAQVIIDRGREREGLER